MNGWDRLLEILETPKYFLLILMLIYTPFMYYGIKAETYDSDEYIYYYMAYAISEGERPYADFFCAHMPLMIYPLAIAYNIFSPSFALGKLVPLVSFFFVAFLTYLIGEHYRKHAGVIACALLMLSPTINTYSHSFYGIFFCLALGLASYYSYLTNRKFLSGLLIALAMFSRLNIYPLFLFIFLFSLKEKKFYYGMLAASPLLLFFLTPNFVEDTILYHLQRLPDDINGKLHTISIFVTTDWLIISLSLTGIMVVCFAENWRDLNSIWKDIKNNGRSEMRIIIFTILFFVLIMTNRSLFNFYFIFDLSFMSIIGAIGLLKIGKIGRLGNFLTVIPPLIILIGYDIHPVIPIIVIIFISCFIKEKKVVFLVLGILIFGAYSNYYPIKTAFQSNRIITYDEIASYIASNTDKEDKVLYIGFGNAYAGLKSDRILAGNFIDITDQVFFRYGSKMDDIFFKAMNDGAPLVVVDLRHTGHLYEKGIFFPKTMEYLHSNYVPTQVFYGWDRKENRPFVLWTRRDRLKGSKAFEKPIGNETVYLFQRYYYYMGDDDIIDEKVESRLIDISQPYIPEALRGRNIYNLTLIPENVIRWPLREGDHYKINVSLRTSDVYVASAQEGMIKIMVDTHYKYITASFSEIVYNYTAKRTERVLSFSKIGDKLVKGFIPSYQQIPLTKVEYQRFLDYADSIKSESFDEITLNQEEYTKSKSEIIMGANATISIELKR